MERAACKRRERKEAVYTKKAGERARGWRSSEREKDAEVFLSLGVFYWLSGEAVRGGFELGHCMI